MAKWLFTLFILLCSSYVVAFQEAMVYRWVDENGNVHFSDLPRDSNAKLVDVKPGITAKADTAKFPEPVVNSAEDSEMIEGDAEFSDIPNSAEACRDLKVEMSKRMRELNGTTPERQRLARIFITEAEKTLKENGCI